MALVLTGPSKSEVRPQTEPSLACGPGEVQVRVYAVGVCATDTEMFAGSMAYLAAGMSVYPVVPGHEWAGEIMQLGANCPSHLKVGQHVVGEHVTGCASLQRVQSMASEAAAAPPPPPLPAPGAARRGASAPKLTAAWSGACVVCMLPGGAPRCPDRAETGFIKRDGAFATRLRFPADQLYVLPDSIPWPTAALAEPLSTAFKGVRLAGLKTAEASTLDGRPPRVAVIGEGTIGLLALQVLRWRGFRVAVVGATAARLARAKEMGAETLYNVAEIGADSLRQAIEKDGPLPEHVIEAAGHPSAVATALQAVAPGGKVVLMGLSGNQSSQITWDSIVHRQISIIGSLASDPEDWQAAVDFMTTGALQSVVTHKFLGLQNYEKAIGMVEKPPPDMLKLCLLVREEADDGETTPSAKRQRTE